MNDLQQISLDLKQATSRSLLVIDEFGKGTNESGLLISLSSISGSVSKWKYPIRWYWTGMRNPRAFVVPGEDAQGNRGNPFPRNIRKWFPQTATEIAVGTHGGPNRR